MAVQFATYDDKDMKSGTFYSLQINKDMANALIEAMPTHIVDFTNTKYINEPYITDTHIEIWEKQVYKDIEKHINITNSVDWYIEKPYNRVVVNSNNPITGYIKMYK